MHLSSLALVVALTLCGTAAQAQSHEAHAGEPALDSAGVQSPAELLRREAGVDVSSPFGAVTFLGLRGLTGAYNNRVPVFLDGLKYTDPWMLGQPSLGFMHLHPGDLQSVDVSRGACATPSCSGGMLGAIRLRSRRPLEHPGPEGQISLGLYHVPAGDGPGASDTHREQSHQGYVAYGWVNPKRSLGARVSATLGQPAELREFEADSEAGEFHYGVRGSLDWLPSKHTHMGLDVSHGQQQTLLTGQPTLGRPRSEQALGLHLNQGTLGLPGLSLELALHGRQSSAELRDYGLMGGEATRDASHREGHGSLDLQLRSFAGRNQISVGAGGMRATTTFFDGAEIDSQELNLWLSERADLIGHEYLVLVGRISAKRLAFDSAGTETNFDCMFWRGQVATRLADGHRLSASVAQGHNDPVPLQVLAGWRGPGGTEPDAVASLAPNPTLGPETNTTYMLTYEGAILEGLQLQARSFYQRLQHLITLSQVDSLPAEYINLGERDQVGLELETSFRLSDALSGYAHYSFTHDLHSTPEDQGDGFPAHIAGAGLEADILHSGWLLRTDGWFSGAQQITGATPFERDLDDTGLAMLRQVDTTAPWRIVLDLRLKRAFFEGQGEIFVAGKNLLGFLHARDDLVQDPLIGMPIGATVLIGASWNGAAPH